MNRNRSYDLLRIIACVFVVSIHTIGAEFTASFGRYVNLIEIMIRWSVPAFFMLSGALFIGRERFDTRRFFRKNVVHLLLIWLAWSIIYFLHSLTKSHYESIDDALTSLFSGDSGYQLWFLPVMIMIYVLIPVFNEAILHKRLAVRYLLIVLFFFWIVPYTIKEIPGCPASLLALLGKFDPYYFRYIGYALLGYYLKEVRLDKKKILFAAGGFLLNTLVFAHMNIMISEQAGRPLQTMYAYLKVPQWINACLVFMIIMSVDMKGLSDRAGRLLERLSGDTLGVFLVHILVLDYYLRYAPWQSIQSVVIRIPVNCLAVSAASFVIADLLRRIPLLRKLVE